jgi:hypothetical protein
MIREDMVEELLSVMDSYRPFPPEMKPFTDFVDKVAEFRAGCKTLEDLMSEISSECMLNSWCDTLDTDLWVRINDEIGGGFWYGMAEVSDEQRDELVRLSTKVGGWIVWDEMIGTTRFIPCDQMAAFSDFAERTRPHGVNRFTRIVGKTRPKK